MRRAVSRQISYFGKVWMRRALTTMLPTQLLITREKPGTDRAGIEVLGFSGSCLFGSSDLDRDVNCCVTVLRYRYRNVFFGLC